ncbi:MAG: hypothetical protein WKG32_07820 [Gemmatimonadaceae bacterium]
MKLPIGRTPDVPAAASPAPEVTSPGDVAPLRAAASAPTSGSAHATSPVTRDVLIAAALAVVATLYLWLFLDRGWYPHDEGTLGHSAERVLQGELPHRDFDELYTGGLTFFHAAAFRLFGINVMTLRYVLLAVFAVWVPALYYAATRFVRPLLAAAAVLVAVVWSVPAYPAAMPSWYNLFLATFAGCALLRHSETGRKRWLIAAGAAAGVSLLVKVVGLYTIAAALLYFVSRESDEVEDDREWPAKPIARAVAYRLFVIAGLGLFASMLAALAYGYWSASDAAEPIAARAKHAAIVLYHFVLPGAAIAGGLAFRTWMRRGERSNAQRIAALVRLAAPFFLGVAIPIGLFLGPYALGGALDDLARGVLLAPAKRYATASRWPPGPSTAAYAAALLALLAAGWRLRGRRASWLEGGIVGACVVLLAVGPYALAYRAVWYSLQSIVPLVAVAGALALARSPRVERTVIVLGLAAMQNLVQLPFAAPVYVCYVVPLAVLALLSLAPSKMPERLAVPGVVLAFYLLYGVRWIDTGFIHLIGLNYAPHEQTARLTLERGGMRISPAEKVEYERLVPLVQAHARGAYIYAAPDCPEVYFLTGLANPTRTLFDVLDPDNTRSAAMLELLERRRVNVVVLNHQPEFSRLDAELAAAIALRYANVEQVGRFEVRWR